MLGWLLFVRTPATDKQLISLIDTRDALVRELTERHNAAVKELAERYSSSVKEVIERYQAVIIERSTKMTEIDQARQNYYRDSLNTLTTHCENEHKFIAGSFKANLDEMRSFLTDARRVLDELRRNPSWDADAGPKPGRPPRGIVSDPDAGKEG